MKIKWDLEHVYFYLVSFVSLILIIIGAVNLTQTAIACVTPIYEDYGPYSQISSNRELVNWEKSFGKEFIEAERIRYETIMKENSRCLYRSCRLLKHTLLLQLLPGGSQLALVSGRGFWRKEAIYNRQAHSFSSWITIGPVTSVITGKP